MYIPRGPKIENSVAACIFSILGPLLSPIRSLFPILFPRFLAGFNRHWQTRKQDGKENMGAKRWLMVYERQSVVNLSFSFRTPSTIASLPYSLSQTNKITKQKRPNDMLAFVWLFCYCLGRRKRPWTAIFFHNVISQRKKIAVHGLFPPLVS